MGQPEPEPSAPSVVSTASKAQANTWECTEKRERASVASLSSFEHRSPIVQPSPSFNVTDGTARTRTGHEDCSWPKPKQRERERESKGE